jgi:hypothetical protein
MAGFRSFSGHALDPTRHAGRRPPDSFGERRRAISFRRHVWKTAADKTKRAARPFGPRLAFARCSRFFGGFNLGVWIGRVGPHTILGAMPSRHPVKRKSHERRNLKTEAPFGLPVPTTRVHSSSLSPVGLSIQRPPPPCAGGRGVVAEVPWRILSDRRRCTPERPHRTNRRRERSSRHSRTKERVASRLAEPSCRPGR